MVALECSEPDERARAIGAANTLWLDADVLRSTNTDGEGFFLKPTLFGNVTKEMSIYQDEIFGPVLSVLRVKTYDEAVKLIGRGPAPGTGDAERLGGIHRIRSSAPSSAS